MAAGPKITAAGGRTPSPLSPFAYGWVGGDIHGLSAFAGTLYRYVPEIEDVLTAVSGKVQQTVSGDSWQGTAASAFAAAWERDAAAGAALGTVTGQAGVIVDQLAVTLAGIENVLEQAADQAMNGGVAIGAGGSPAQTPSAGAQQARLAADYQSFRTQCLDDAQHARDQAAGALQNLYGQIAPPDRGLTADQYNSVADYLRGLWAIPTSYRKFVDSKIPGMEKNVTAARVAAREDARLSDGRFGSWTDQGKQQFAAEKARLQSVEEQASNAAAHENLSTRILGSGVSDVAGGSADLGKAARFFGDIPFASAGLAGVGADLTIAGDRAQGQSWAKSASDGVTSNTAALVAGEGAADLGVAGGAAAAGFLGAGATVAGVTGVGIGVAAGGLVAVGVGDLVHNAFQENWGADIRQHGVLGGLGHGTVDTLDHTRHDLASMADGTLHTARHVWDSIF